MRRKEDLQVYSYDAREIMSGIPSSIQRTMLYVITIIIIVLLAGSYIFHYPDVVLANVQIKPSNRTHAVISQTTGYISKIYKGNSEMIKQGELIAEIVSTSNGEDINRALDYVQRTLDSLRKGGSLIESPSYDKLLLGTLEQSYQTVLQSIERLRSFQEQHYYMNRILDQHKLNALNKSIREEAQKQLQINRERMELAYSQLRRDSLLWVKGLISDEAYEQARANTLNYEGVLSSSNSNIRDKQRVDIEGVISVLDLERNKVEEEMNLRLSLETSSRIFISEVNSWRERYQMISQEDGVLVYWGSRQEKQYVVSGEQLFSIASIVERSPTGVLTIEPSGFGKVKVGQRVLIRLTNYPDAEYGTLEAIVKYISPLADENGLYRAEVSFSRGLTTSYGIKLDRTIQLLGSAEIITKERRLIERILEPIYKVLHQNT